MIKKTPVVLMILDGWGYRKEREHNAISLAKTPQWDAWWETRPHALLTASGMAVGLPDHQMGNSEVGHMHIGAGRRVLQDLTRINTAITTGDYETNPVFLNAIHHTASHSNTLHIMGLLSPGGVHSHEEHLFALLTLCAKEPAPNVCLHLFLDGRDTPPQSALESLAKLKSHLSHCKTVRIASITGRYYAMDRDARWARLEPVYHLLTSPNQTVEYHRAEDAIHAFYQQGIFDEFIPPTAIGTRDRTCIVQDGDTVLFFNFRADRARQLTQAFLSESFNGFERPNRPKLREFISMTPYADDLPTIPAFPTIPLHNTLGEVLSQHGLSQLRLAETEKYAHVTFFLNGGLETTFANESRTLIPSPLVATYDLMPKMSALALTTALVRAIKTGDYDVIICNYANADMVGHTGHLNETKLAIECLDEAMQTVWAALEPIDGQLLITADHGNAEMMFDEKTHQPHTAHTCEPVPFLYVGNQPWRITTSTGQLTDIAPTLLTLLGIAPPIEMTGHPLLCCD